MNPFDPGYLYRQQFNPPSPLPQPVPQTIQNNGFISVRNEMEARNYPIAPGNSVTFIDETSPYCYTKTMGFSQLDRPIFKRFRLVEETDQPEPSQSAAMVPPVDYMADINALKASYQELSKQVEWIRSELGIDSEKGADK